MDHYTTTSLHPNPSRAARMHLSLAAPLPRPGTPSPFGVSGDTSTKLKEERPKITRLVMSPPHLPLCRASACPLAPAVGLLTQNCRKHALVNNSPRGPSYTRRHQQPHAPSSPDNPMSQSDTRVEAACSRGPPPCYYTLPDWPSVGPITSAENDAGVATGSLAHRGGVVGLHHGPDVALQQRTRS